MANFHSYLHVERLTSSDCEGLLDNDNVVVTAKVDATNACVWYDPEQNRLRTGSRKREINLNKDNFKGVEHFSEIFNRIFNFFRFSVLGICILAIIIGVLIYLGFMISLKSRYM